VFLPGFRDALRRGMPLMAFALGVYVIAGCSIFPSGEGAKRLELNRPSLPPIQTSQESIQLEVVFVDRPAGDPVLGPLLWREVDQVAAIPAETRDMLQQNGFQVGHVSSSPPVAVQKLLGLVSDVRANDDNDGQHMVGSRKILPPGIDTELQSSEAIEKCAMTIVEGSRTKTYEYEQVRCMFRMKSVRLSDGWVRIDFLPEIHHGDLRLRHTPTDEGWVNRNRQKVDARHAQKFSLTMNVGEMVIITAAPDQSDSMGERFFCRDDNGTKLQRLLIVRVADAGRSPDSF
jgi:hypothetical protein